MDLTKEQLKELGELAKAVTKEAKKVVKDYKNNPSEMSSSITQISINSPLLKDKDVD